MARGWRKDTRRKIEYDQASSDGITFDDEGQVNEFAQSVEQSHGMDPRARVIFIICVVLVVVYVFGLVVPKDLFNASAHQSGYNAGYSFSWFVEDLMTNMNALVSVCSGQGSGVVWFTNTMLRYVVVALAGAGLALCGAVYQGAFKNALVTPTTLGVGSGATLGMVAWIMFFIDDEGDTSDWAQNLYGASEAVVESGSSFISSYSLAFCSFLGCVAAVALVLLTMKLMRSSRMNGVLMIVTGQVIGGIFGALVYTVRYYCVVSNPYGAKAELITDLAVSSFYRMYGVIDVLTLLVFVIAIFLVIMRLRNYMMLLQFGDEEARTLGVNARRLRIVTVGLCTLLTAIIISFCGKIGFVGFFVPHLARRMVGPNFGYLLPASTVLGAVFVLGAYVLMAMTFGSAFETLVGMFISIGGAVVFLVTALRGEGGSRGEFR